LPRWLSPPPPIFLAFAMPEGYCFRGCFQLSFMRQPRQAEAISAYFRAFADSFRRYDYADIFEASR
jgi:hypothetical protein